MTVQIVAIIVFLIWLVLGIISSVFLYKLVDCLNENGITAYAIENIFVYRKFKLFIENCDDADKKAHYVQLFRRAVLFKIITFLYFLLIAVLVFLL